MKITTTLALKYLKKNKHRSIITISGIALVTILITTLYLLFSSFQEYLINSTRNKGNFEVKISNISYDDCLKILHHKNVKEISLSHKLGISLENFCTLDEDDVSLNFDVRSYDLNALKNAKIDIIEGRLPTTENEILISYPSNCRGLMPNFKIGDTLKLTTNGIYKEYILVGKASSLEFDHGTGTFHSFVGAITFLSEKDINNSFIYDVSILTNNIHKIYDTTDDFNLFINFSEEKENSNNVNELLNEMDWKSEEVLQNNPFENYFNTTSDNSSTPIITYNKELLRFSNFFEKNNNFANSSLLIMITVSLFIIVYSIIILYTSFKLTYSERIKEFGMLSSIGLNKKQRNNILKKEAGILGFIGISIGLLIGFFLFCIIAYLINLHLKNYFCDLLSEINFFGKNIITNKITFDMKISLLILSIIIIIVYFIVFISSILSIRKINKISIINAIRNSSNIKNNSKSLKSLTFVEKIFGEEGLISYKNIKRDKSKYKTIVICLTTNIILFLSITGFINNYYKNDFLTAMIKTNDYYDYEISGNNLTEENAKKIIKYLKENNLLNDYFLYEVLGIGTLQLSENTMSNDIKKLAENGLLSKNTNNTININIITYYYYGKIYDELLSRANIHELKDNEVILVNNINEPSKYGNYIEITNFKAGDTYVFKTTEGEKVLKIVGIVDTFAPYIIREFDIASPYLLQLTNKNTLKDLSELSSINYNNKKLAIFTDNANKIDENFEEIENLCGRYKFSYGGKLFCKCNFNKQYKINCKYCYYIIYYYTIFYICYKYI